VHADLILPLTIVGIVTGSMYALGAMGIVVIYKTTRVLNFAHGAIGMISAFLAYQLGYLWSMNVGIAALSAIAFSALLGFSIERFTIRPLEGKAPLIKVVVTLGWLLIITSFAGIKWGASAYHVPIKLVPEGTVGLPGVHISYADLATLAVAGVLTAALATFFRLTRLGVAMRAVADDVSSARILGIRVDRVNSTAWILGSVLAAITGILLSPKVALDTYSLTLLVIFSFAAALYGGLVSLPKAFAAAMVLGVVQSVSSGFLHLAGLADLIALAVIIFALVQPGSALMRAVAKEGA